MMDGQAQPEKGKKLYVGTKIIRATTMDECSFLSEIKGDNPAATKEEMANDIPY